MRRRQITSPKDRDSSLGWQISSPGTTILPAQRMAGVTNQSLHGWLSLNVAQDSEHSPWPILSGHVTKSPCHPSVA